MFDEANDVGIPEFCEMPQNEIVSYTWTSGNIILWFSHQMINCVVALIVP